MPISDDYRTQIRQLLSDFTDQDLPDFANPEAKATVPTYRQGPSPEEKGQKLRSGVHLGSALLSSISARNPGLFAEAAAKQMASKFNPLKEKQASLHEDVIGHEDGQKIASDVKERALSVLAQEPPVSVCILALRHIFGEEFYGWEPETIFWELEDYGIRVSDRLRDKINCGLCLALQPAFLNDVTVFENCVRVMNDLELDVTIVQKPDIPYICAAIWEASMLMEREQSLPEDMEFVDDIDTYIALALFHDHYMLAPAELSFTQEILDSYNTNVEEIVPRLKKEWKDYQERLVKGDAEELDENILDVQLGKLTGCWAYVKERMDEIKALTDEL